MNDKKVSTRNSMAIVVILLFVLVNLYDTILILIHQTTYDPKQQNDFGTTTINTIVQYNVDDTTKRIIDSSSSSSSSYDTLVTTAVNDNTKLNQQKQKQQKWSKLIILVEPFINPRALEATIRNALEMTPTDWQLRAFLPKNVGKKFIEQLCTNRTTNTNTNTSNDDIIVQSCLLNRIQYEPLSISYNFNDTEIYDITHWRNQLFTNPFWWKSLNAQWALMIQCDTIICKYGEPPLQYHFLGGPHDTDRFYRSNNTISNTTTNSTNSTNIDLKYNSHMNGGLSIRNITWAIECLESLPFNHHQVHAPSEDDVFAYCSSVVTPVPIEQQPTFKQAALFASDNGHTGCIKYYNTTTNSTTTECPYGIHKPWIRWATTKEEQQELLNSCPGAKELYRINNS